MAQDNHESVPETAGQAAGSDEAAADADRLAEDLGQLREDVAKLAESVSQLVRNQADVGANRLKDGLSAAGGAIGDTAGSFARAGKGLAADAQDRIQTLGEDLEQSIHRSPLTAVVAAAALGMVLGLINRSR